MFKMLETPSITPTRLLRSDSSGLKGTYANMDHHAKVLKRFVDMIAPIASTLGFAEWITGHNVHEFRTVDGRRFTLRGYTRDLAYRGIRLSLRLSRSKEVFLMDVESDAEVDVLVSSMRKLAQPLKGDATPLLKDGGSGGHTVQ